MSVFPRLLQGLTPPPVNIPEEYDGLQWRWKMFVFRPAYFRNEVFLAGILVLYVIFWWFGSSRNRRVANKWLDAHYSIYKQQFSKTETKLGRLSADGYSDYFSFCTGRRNIASLHTVFTFRPRHDLFQFIFQLGRQIMDLQYRPSDVLELDFTLAPGLLPSDFVFAVVAKDELVTIKDNRWDLTLTKTTDNPGIPATFSVMSEFADVTDNILKLLGQLIHDEKIRPYFRSLSVTDQPRDRPNGPLLADEREKHVILSLTVPPTSRVNDTIAFVTGLFPFIDSLNKVHVRPETKAKLRKVREELDKELKADAEKSKKEEMEQAVQDRKAAKKRSEEDRISKLSAAEQRKYLEKEKKKAMRRSQGRVVQK
ncbi:Coiled-coil domain-containing protein 47 [Leucoagaricus sp. SymC.cos]|nr:Coiled-coil domain-containing protein 47 [Leucoagaricus sp. SymC.cos]